MKRFVLAGFCCIYLVACSTVDEPEVDFRQQYVGDWFFASWVMLKSNNEPSEYTDTLNYTGKVSVFGAQRVQIEFRPETDDFMYKVAPFIDANGVLYFPGQPDSTALTDRLEGFMLGADSLHFNYFLGIPSEQVIGIIVKGKKLNPQ